MPVLWLPFGYQRYKMLPLVAKTIRHTECEKRLENQHISAHFKTRKNAKTTTRNEKVACSSQVTSSSKTADFNEKSAVLLTFLGGLKASQIGLAFIWRYFPRNSNFERLEFTQFLQMSFYLSLDFFMQQRISQYKLYTVIFYYLRYFWPSVYYITHFYR